MSAHLFISAGPECLRALRVETCGESLDYGESRNVGCHGCERYGGELGLAEVPDREDGGYGERVLEGEG